VHDVRRLCLGEYLSQTEPLASRGGVVVFLTVLTHVLRRVEDQGDFEF